MSSARRFATALLSVIGLVFAHSASAGVNRWTSQGPDGGKVGAIAVDPSNPSTIYASKEYGGMYRSDDGGLSWRALDPYFVQVRTMAVDPSRYSTVYAAGDIGVLKSVDGGQTWAYTNEGLEGGDRSVLKLVIDPTNPDTIYVATLDWIFKSVDGGCSWQKASTGLPATNTNYTYNLTIDPTNSATLYLGSLFIGAFKSTDAGASWSSISVGFIYAGVSVTVDPSHPSRLWAADVYFNGDLGGGGGTVFKSEDGGLSWQPSNAGLPDAIYLPIIVDPTSPTTLWAPTTQQGIFRSDDGGVNWSPASGGLEDLSVNAAVLIPGPTQTLLAGSSTTGISRSDDGGGSWTPSNAGFHGVLWQSLALSAADSNILFAGGNGNTEGLAKSADGGRTWQRTGPGLNTQAGWVGLDPTNASVVYVTQSDKISKSTDGGATWNPADSGLAGGIVYSIAVDPADPSRVLAGTAGGVFRSLDGGGSWVAATTPLTDTYNLLAAGDGSWYAIAGPFSAFVYASGDHGDTWTPVSSGLPTPNLRGLALDPSNASVLYVGSVGQGTFKSVDSGLNWSALGGPANLAISSMAVDPDDPADLFAATEGYSVFYTGAGVFRSTDGGLNWSPFNTGFDGGNTLEVHALAIRSGASGPVLYASNGHANFDQTISSAAGPHANSAAPFAGPRLGGTVVTISGLQFQNGAEVLFGTIPAASVSFIDGGTISATTPAGAAGPADIVVRNPDTQDSTLARGFVYDYDDVPESASYHDAVASLTHAGVTVGCGKGLFCPDLPITRAQMAVFVEKTIHGPDFTYPSPTVSFVDVFSCSPEGKYILQLGSEGATAGCGPDYFCPQAGNTRAQAAVFVLKAEHGGDYVPPAATGTVFADIPAGAFAANFIEQLAAEGITAGCGGGLFCPDASVTRAQAAAFLSLALLPP